MGRDCSKEIWTLGPAMGGEPFFTLVNQDGNVIALRITSEQWGELLATIPDLHKAAKRARKMHNAFVDRYGNPPGVAGDMAALDVLLSKLGF